MQVGTNFVVTVHSCNFWAPEKDSVSLIAKHSSLVRVLVTERASTHIRGSLPHKLPRAQELPERMPLVNLHLCATAEGWGRFGWEKSFGPSSLRLLTIYKSFDAIAGRSLAECNCLPKLVPWNKRKCCCSYVQSGYKNSSKGTMARQSFCAPWQVVLPVGCQALRVSVIQELTDLNNGVACR
eukprot:4378894-Amphidinium_carterae.1